VARYQRLFREFIAEWMGDPAVPDPTTPGPPRTALRAELMAASVVAAHNHVLRRWLRGESQGPTRELDDAMREVIGMFAAAGAPKSDTPGSGTTIVAFRADADIDAIVPALRRISQDQPLNGG
jgi:hypothetical protein